MADPTPWIGSLDSLFSESPFFQDEPRKLMEMGKIPKNVPIMIGVTEHEGFLKSLRLFHNKDKFDMFKLVCYQNYA